MNQKEIPQQIKRLSIKIQQTADQLTMPPSRLETDLLKRLCMEQYELILMLISGVGDPHQFTNLPVIETQAEKKPVESPKKEEPKKEELKKEEPEKKEEIKKEATVESQKYTDEEYNELLKEYKELLAQHKKQLEEEMKAREKSAQPDKPETKEPATASEAEQDTKLQKKDQSLENTAGTKEAPKQNGVKPQDNGRKESPKVAETMDPALFYPREETPETKAADTNVEDKKEAPKKEATPVKPPGEKAKPPLLNIYRLEKMVAEEETITPAVHHVGPVPEKREETTESISAEGAVKAREKAKSEELQKQKAEEQQRQKTDEQARQEENARILAERKEKKTAEPVKQSPVAEKAVEQEVAESPVSEDQGSGKPRQEEELMDLNRKLGESMQNKDLHTRLRETPLADLKSGITINKKIAYMNNLFESSIDKYDNAIALLNSSQSLSTALQHFSGLRIAYNWGHENELAEELEELIKRRYSS